MFKCYCILGFIGEYCYVDYNECVLGFCKNGVLCIDEVNGYKCICDDDMFG